MTEGSQSCAKDPEKVHNPAQEGSQSCAERFTILRKASLQPSCSQMFMRVFCSDKYFIKGLMNFNKMETGPKILDFCAVSYRRTERRCHHG